MKSTIDLSKALTKEKLTKSLSKMNDNLVVIERKVQPIANMAETVQFCKNNINVALDQINIVTSNISEQEDIVDILVDRKTMINSEFDIYIKSMHRAMDLIKYFEQDLVYFRDSFTISENLKQALKTAVEECDRYLEANIKKLLDVSSKKHIKRYKELLRVLELAQNSEDGFRKYLKFYVDFRRLTFKTLLNNQSSSDKHVELSLSKIDGGSRMSILTGVSSSSYERGSHPAIGQVTEIAKQIEEEYQVSHSIFEVGGGGGMGGYSALSIAVKVVDRLIFRLAEILTQCETELTQLIASVQDQSSTIKPFIVMLDVMETLHESMPKSFLQLIRVKELPLKKAVEGILMKSQQLILTVSRVTGSSYDEEVDDDEMTALNPNIAMFVSMLSDVSNYPKSFRMIEFINRQIKDDSKKFNFYNDLVAIIQTVEARKEKYKKKFSIKFQFIINNYGFIYSRLESDAIQQLFSLASEESIISEVKQSLDFHMDQFAQYVWKDPRAMLKRMFTQDQGGIAPDFAEISDQLQTKVDQILRKDFKKYKIATEIGQQVKHSLKQAMLKAICSMYSKYLKAVKPENGYSLEDIELSVEKLLRIN